MRGWLTKTVLILSLVSLLNDAASELLFPVLPLWMKQAGYGLLWIGIAEGIAEAVAGLTKGWFGQWSDRRGERLPFVRLGYLLSALSKPLLPLISAAPWVVFMRSTDRLGKGLRSGARDALLAQQATPEERGRVFGFHRSMDTLGAVIGPLLALWWLWLHPGEAYTTLFMLALIPGLLSVLLLLFLREKKTEAISTKPPSLLAAFSYWKQAGADYKKLTTWLVFFALFNSSDMFLLLLAHEVLPDQVNVMGHLFAADFCVVGLYIFYNLVYSLMAYPAGWLSDRFHPRFMLYLGLCSFALTYAGMGWLSTLHNAPLVWLPILFLIYGFYTACTDGVSKAWTSTLCGKNEKASALGLQAGLNSLALLVASTAAGIIWSQAGAAFVFWPAAVAALLCISGLHFSRIRHSASKS
ncbi:MAG: MFS transporter [Bacteroidia bacterium]|jgi:MFS family permease|nr:MFS transporter [Bacteroidia bacterium]